MKEGHAHRGPGFRRPRASPLPQFRRRSAATPLGRLLRRWSLDELPQLWNVLRGDMSLVGPRPELDSIVGLYEPWQHARHLVKPGLTGLWQVYARGDGTVMHERTELDIVYVLRIGLLTDVRVLLLTVPAVIGARRGS